MFRELRGPFFIKTIAGNGLPAAARTPLHIAAQQMKVPLGDAAIMAWPPRCAPIVLFTSVRNAGKVLGIDDELPDALCA
jgi:hypothetical protein